MASILEFQLIPGSFRGIPFLMTHSSITGGRKTVIHEFPNSDRRYVEDLGLLNETIEIDAQVASDFYFAQRDAIKAALDQPGYGTLIHPFYGTRNVAITNYSISESPNSLGLVEIKMTCAVGQELLFPGQTDSADRISGQSDILFESLSEFFTENFEVDTSFAFNILSFIRIASSFGSLVGTTGTSYTARSDFDDSAFAPYKLSLESYNSSVASNIQNPQGLVDSTQDLMENLDNVANNGQQGFDIGVRCSTFTLPVPLYAATTTLQEANYNQGAETLLVLFKSLSFAQIANNIVLYPIVSMDDINMVREILDSVYLELINLLEVGSDLCSNIQDIRATVIEYLDNKSLTTPSIISKKVTRIPLSVIAYQYYGNLDNDETLRVLNHTAQPDPAALNGDVKLYSDFDQ